MDNRTAEAPCGLAVVGEKMGSVRDRFARTLSFGGIPWHFSSKCNNSMLTYVNQLYRDTRNHCICNSEYKSARLQHSKHH